MNPTPWRAPGLGSVPEPRPSWGKAQAKCRVLGRSLVVCPVCPSPPQGRAGLQQRLLGKQSGLGLILGSLLLWNSRRQRVGERRCGEVSGLLVCLA